MHQARYLPVPTQRGLTLIELLVILAITVTLLSTAAPDFSQLLQKTRTTTEVNTLLAHLNLARSEAIKRGTAVVLCPSSSGNGCEATIEWHHGYMLFVDLDGDRKHDHDEPLLRHYQAETDGLAIRSAKSANGRKKITYFSSGTAKGYNAT